MFVFVLFEVNIFIVFLSEPSHIKFTLCAAARLYRSLLSSRGRWFLIRV